MSIADTLLLINDQPNKPLNRHFDDSLIVLTNRILNAIQYISSDNAIHVVTEITVPQTGVTVFEEKMKHGGSLRIKLGSNVVGDGVKKDIFVNGTNISANSGISTEFSFNKNDVVKIVLKPTGTSGTSIISSFSLCGMPMLVDF